MNVEEVNSLQGTVDLMLSHDWKERLVAEYLQTKIRKESLYQAIMRESAKFTSKPPNRVILREYEMMEIQYKVMKEYLLALEVRLKGLNIYVGTGKTEVASDI